MTEADAAPRPAVPFGIYVHVPFCASRCGYCAFNTYTVSEAGGHPTVDAFVDAARAEIGLARAAVGDRLVDTVFFGGGTPTMLPADQLIGLLNEVRARFRTAADLEVTVEANPDSVDAGYVEHLARAGVTRVSLGMQSIRRSVLAVLERTHTPGAVERAARAVHAAGIAHLNIDLMYGTPGETADDLAASVDAVLGMGADHVSAYALGIEPKTRLAAQVRAGTLPRPDDDVAAERYAWLDQRLAAAGFAWYELSNWARQPGARCRHNLLYWRGGDWWGVGPGAHSHLDGARWVNVAAPADYAERVAAGAPLAVERETVTPEGRRLEALMTRIRLAEGCGLEVAEAVSPAAPARAAELVADGLVELDAGRLRLTAAGRPLADLVLRRLVG